MGAHSAHDRAGSRDRWGAMAHVGICSDDASSDEDNEHIPNDIVSAYNGNRDRDDTHTEGDERR